jgi:cytochrome c553
MGGLISSAPDGGATLLLMTAALALSPAERPGKVFALTNCAHCHSVDRVTQSPLKIAPPFRSLHLRYAVETLGEALAEGIENRSCCFALPARHSITAHYCELTGLPAKLADAQSPTK